MKPLLIVANFKSHMTIAEAKNWLKEFNSGAEVLKNKDKKVILCPPFTLFYLFSEFIKQYDYPIQLGAQNISRLPEGPYTGEINGAQIKDFADYVLIGHSERRQFGEDESVVEEKIKIAKDYNLTPILCVQNGEDKIPQEVKIAAFEPTFAIGTGTPDTPENAQLIAEKFKASLGLEKVLYGGSVNADNVKNFTNMKDLDGVLVGSNSLNPQWFSQIIENA